MQFQALKDRLVEIKFNDLALEGKNGTLRKFIRDMCGKYQVVLSEEREQRMLTSVANVVSIRDAKKSVEKQLLEEKKRNIADAIPLFIPQVATFVISPDVQAAIHLHHYLSPPHLDEIDLQRQLKSLETTNELIKLLSSYQQGKQYEGMKGLFGERGKFRNAYANVQTLWKTAWLRKKAYRERAGGIQALANRIKRFNCPQQKEKILRFHIQAAQVLLHSLLNITKSSDKYVWTELKDNAHRKANLQIFMEHLALLSSFQDKLNELTDARREPRIIFGEEVQEFLRESGREIRKEQEKIARLLENAPAEAGEDDDHIELLGEDNPLLNQQEDV